MSEIYEKSTDYYDSRNNDTNPYDLWRLCANGRGWDGSTG